MEFKFLGSVKEGDLYAIVSDDADVDGCIGVVETAEPPYQYSDASWYNRSSARGRGWLCEVAGVPHDELADSELMLASAIRDKHQRIRHWEAEGHSVRDVFGRTRYYK